MHVTLTGLRLGGCGLSLLLHLSDTCMGRYWAGLLLVVSPWGSYTAVSYQHRFLSEEFGTRT